VVCLRTPENFLYYLSMHEDCSDSVLAGAEALDAKDIELSINPKAARIKKMVAGVLAEIHRLEGFVRLEQIGNHHLAGYMRPRHRTGSHICGYFARRSPFTIIVLGNGMESWISLNTGKDLLQARGGGLDHTIEELRSALGYAYANSGIEEFWRVYYSSQYSPARRNITAFHRRMPRSSLNSAGLEVEQNNNGLTLSDFF
jgi:hypothetical protein